MPMGWKERRARSYYYRSRRAGATVKSEYIGAGEIAALIARSDAIERAEREAQRRRQRAEWEAEAAVDRQIDDLGSALGDLVTAVLLVSGHHKHKRGWRRERANNQD